MGEIIDFKPPEPEPDPTEHLVRPARKWVGQDPDTESPQLPYTTEYLLDQNKSLAPKPPKPLVNLLGETQEQPTAQSLFLKFHDRMVDQAAGALYKQPEDLTDMEKVALAFTAGCQMKWEPGPDRYHPRLATKNRVGFFRLHPGEPLLVKEYRPDREDSLTIEPEETSDDAATEE